MKSYEPVTMWVEDAQIAIVSDSPVEAIDIADTAKSAGFGPILLMRSASALSSLMESKELRPRLVVVTKSLDDSEASAVIDRCREARASVIWVDDNARASEDDRVQTLMRPFGVDEVRSAFDRAGLRSA